MINGVAGQTKSTHLNAFISVGSFETEPIFVVMKGLSR
jgi:hypothetical protein